MEKYTPLIHSSQSEFILVAPSWPIRSRIIDKDLPLVYEVDSTSLSVEGSQHKALPSSILVPRYLTFDSQSPSLDLQPITIPATQLDKAVKMAAANEPPLDEIQWRHPLAVQEMGGIHSNTVLFYFAESPFFDRTSNNAVLYNQAMFNPNMHVLIQTREAFEGRLREMSGLEYIVAQEPAEMGPGMGTGVWVIHKQTRRKRDPEDEITVHAAYYVIGENIYMAPTLADILSFRMVIIRPPFFNNLTNFCRLR